MNDDKILIHYGIKGQRRGVRRFQNEDGSLTAAGRNRYLEGGGDGWDSRDPNAGNSVAKRMARSYDNNARTGADLDKNRLGRYVQGTYDANRNIRKDRYVKRDGSYVQNTNSMKAIPSVKSAVKDASQFYSKASKGRGVFNENENLKREASEAARLDVAVNRGGFNNASKSQTKTAVHETVANRVSNSISNAVQTGAKSVSSAVSKAYSASKETISKAANSGKSAISSLLSRLKKK